MIVPLFETLAFGTGFTVTVISRLSAQSFAPVAITVYVVVEEGLTCNSLVVIVVSDQR